ncbi:MAG: DNA translocase FtsK [Chloroflexia bacterium]|nr:DNA translocase FtsK [Chloroflexia bacterium]
MTRDHPLRPWLDHQADRIEQLCQAHRVPVQVQGGVVTPRLVRFHLALSPRVSLKRLDALQEDLALALNAPSARLSRSNGTLALEVPRPQPAGISLVRLQAMLPALPGDTALLGRDEEGTPLLLRLSAPEVTHLLIAGTTGSGKTALARSILASLALANDPDDLRLLLIDPKGHGFGVFAGLPHLLAPPVRQESEALRRLEWLVQEMEWREGQRVRAPIVVVGVDEVADLVAQEPRVGELLTRLAARGRESGLHLLLSTQKPTAEAIGSLLRSNLPCRLTGRVLSAQDAVVATGIKRSGAERLLGRGDFLLVSGGEALRFQAAYISAEEIGVMVEMFEQELVQAEAAHPLLVPRREGKVIAFPGGWIKRVAALVSAAL